MEPMDRSDGYRADMNTLLRRAFMFLEDRDWYSADLYSERVLDMDPECGEAYLCKLMAELNCSNREQLRQVNMPFDHLRNYRKAVRYGQGQQASLLEDAVAFIRKRNEINRLGSIYHNALGMMSAARTQDEFEAAAAHFSGISGYLDAEEKGKQCLELAETARKDAIYAQAAQLQAQDTPQKLWEANEAFRKIQGWRDADAQAAACNARRQELLDRRAKLAAKLRIYVGIPVFILIIIWILLST